MSFSRAVSSCCKRRVRSYFDEIQWFSTIIRITLSWSRCMPLRSSSRAESDIVTPISDGCSRRAAKVRPATALTEAGCGW